MSSRTCFAAVMVVGTLQTVSAQPVRTVTHFPDGQDLPYLGNGVLGYRIKPNPFTTWKAVASGYVADHEAGGWETLAYTPYPFRMDFALDDSPSMLQRPDAARILRQSLDMSCGELTTELEFPLGAAAARVEVLQFISRTTPVVSCQQVRLTLHAPGTLHVTAALAAGPGNEVTSRTPPGHDRVTDLMAGFTAAGRRSACGVAVKLEFDAPDVQRGELDPADALPRRSFTLPAAKNQTLTIRTLAATLTSAYHPDPHLEACRLVNWADALGFDKLRDDNRRAWADIWRSRIRVTGDDRAQDYLDRALFYTFSSVHPSSRTSMPPFGTSQIQNYFGHVFWDTDTYTTPALILLAPDAAKMTVDFRRRNLDAAKRRAAAYGFAGAMYPWESGTRGEEATPSTVDTGWLQQHVNMCVALSAWWVQQAAGDDARLRETTWPILEAVAQWIESRVVKTGRGYEIRNVMSSHEGLMVHNSAYVNAVAAETLRVANRCAKRLGLPPRAAWADIAERLFIPVGPAPGVTGDIIHMHDAGWVEDAASTDMFMLAFPFDLPFDPGLLRRTHDFYMTLPNDKLSMGVAFFIGQSAALGDRRGQRVLFDRVLDELTEPVWGMGLEYTGDQHACFVTTMAGMLQTTLMAMTGLRFEPDHWTKYPACLPEGWTRIECGRIHLAGRTYRLEAAPGQPAVLTPTE